MNYGNVHNTKPYGMFHTQTQLMTQNISFFYNQTGLAISQNNYSIRNRTLEAKSLKFKDAKLCERVQYGILNTCMYMYI